MLSNPSANCRSCLFRPTTRFFKSLVAFATVFLVRCLARENRGAAYWIPAFWVPALLVSHYVVFVVMLAGRRAQIHEAFTRRIDASDKPRVPRAGAA